MPDTNTGQVLVPVGIMFVTALGMFVAAAGLLYWALHNFGRDLREEMREGNRLLREEMREGFRRLENIIMRHQHDDDGYPIVRFRPSENE